MLLVWPSFVLKRACDPSVVTVGMETDCCAPLKQHLLLKSIGDRLSKIAKEKNPP